MALYQIYTYSIPKRRPKPKPNNRLAPISAVKDSLPLSGRLQGKAATDLEERFGRALKRAGLAFTFQWRVAAHNTIPGNEKLVDFLVENGLRCPVEIDGEFAHHSAAQQGQDLVREILLNHTFIRRGIQPIRRVKWWQLASQELADQQVGEMFGGGG